MRPYADTNFLVGLYLEVGAYEQAEAILLDGQSSGMESLPITSLLSVEMVNAFQLHVFLSRKHGQWRVAPEAAGAALSLFESDVNAQTIFGPEEIGWTELRSEAQNLSLRHTAKHGFRTYDLLHVSSALILECDVFWSFDLSARKLAQLEGMRVNDV